jgi:D-alanyl-D-alanine carboxypeptidase
MLSRALVACAVALLMCATPALARYSPTAADYARSFPMPPVRARAAIVMDATNGNLLFAKNPHLQLPIASTTKIMTALVALQLGHLDDKIKVPKAAFNYEWDATVMGLKPGEVVTLRDLLYGLLLPSGADAANTIAIHYAGSEARFVDRMNHTASLLGLKDTHYVNTHGLTAPGAHSSAYDLAVLGQYVSYLPDFMQIVSSRSYTWNGHTLVNLNKLLFWYPGIDGIKPGYTDDAGICQVLDERRDGRHIVVVLLNTPDLDLDSRNLLDYGLHDYRWVQSPYPGDGPSFVQAGADRYGSFLYFPASGHYVRGAFAAAFRADGGVAALGLPRTEVLNLGGQRVQYFQNGALSLAGTARSPVRLALGLTPLPTPTATPRPSPTRAPITPTPPSEGTLRLTGTPTVTPKPARTPTPKPKPHVTRTPPPPPPAPLPSHTAAPSRPVAANKVFAAYLHAHPKLMGAAVGALQWTHGYGVQVFSYGALAYAPKTKTVYLLPVGDRLLAAQGYLPSRPGNVYPLGFAPAAVLKAVGWLPS